MKKSFFKLLIQKKLYKPAQRDADQGIFGLFLGALWGLLSVIFAYTTFFEAGIVLGMFSLGCFYSSIHCFKSSKIEQINCEKIQARKKEIEDDPFYKEISEELNDFKFKNCYIEKCSHNLKEFDMVLSMGKYLVGINRSKEEHDQEKYNFQINYFNTVSKEEIIPPKDISFALVDRFWLTSQDMLKENIKSKKEKSVFQKAIEAYSDVYEESVLDTKQSIEIFKNNKKGDEC